mmetsp:Transcript_30996/g.67542  ORF Transcript_30996/g.67542 Transcript_30996/m.67542 type:complete len:255 (-) Transcript_30996:314-1078(-)
MSSSSGFGGSCSSFNRCLMPATDSAAQSKLLPLGSLLGMCLSRNCSRVSSGPERNPSAGSSASALWAAPDLVFLVITDSLVVHREKTTHSPLATASRPSATACGILAATIRPLKKRCWLAQKRLSTDLPSSLKASADSSRSMSCRTSCQRSTAASYCCRIFGVSLDVESSNIVPSKARDRHEIEPARRSCTATSSMAATPPFSTRVRKAVKSRKGQIWRGRSVPCASSPDSVPQRPRRTMYCICRTSVAPVAVA